MKDAFKECAKSLVSQASEMQTAAHMFKDDGHIGAYLALMAAAGAVATAAMEINKFSADA